MIAASRLVADHALPCAPFDGSPEAVFVRQTLIMGNWKMHGNRASAVALTTSLVQGWQPAAGVSLAICPPFVHLQAVEAALAGSAIGLGAQHVADQVDDGAFTGEVSAAMLRDAGCGLVLIGHSERRALYGETDASVVRRLTCAWSAGLMPVLCVGETLDEREQGQAEAVVARQLAVLPARAAVIVAYEPVWAIGTGRAATPDDAQRMHAFIRGRLVAQGLSADTLLLYGGSVKPDNAAGLFAQPDIDGALVGGASLVAQDFLEIGQRAIQR